MTQALPDYKLPWPIPWQAVQLISNAEGCRLRAYRCPAGVPTIGWGHTSGVKLGDSCTQEQADQWLMADITASLAEVREACPGQATDNELGALVSFAFNCRGWRNSTVVRAHNKGDRQSASRAFGLWNKARIDGVLTVLPGLTARRAAESALYLTPDDGWHQMPQAIEAESKLTASPIARAGVGATAAGTIGVLQEIGGGLDTVKPVATAAKGFLADTLAIPGPLVPWVLMAVAGLAVWYWRAKQRGEGWA